MNLPNKLTIIRIFLVPVFILVYYLEFPLNSLIAAMIFAVASLTDLFDGYLARKHNIVTNFGKLVDPIADKLLVGSAIILFTGSGIIHPAVAVVLIGREFVISGYRVLAASEGIVMASDIWGKLKTVVQIAGILFILIGRNLWAASHVLMVIGLILIYLSVALSIASCTNYIVKYKNVLKGI